MHEISKVTGKTLRPVTGEQTEQFNRFEISVDITQQSTTLEAIVVAITQKNCSKAAGIDPSRNLETRISFTLCKAP